MSRGLSREKAREILRDGEVHGKPLTDKQRRYFYWVAKGKQVSSEKHFPDSVKALWQNWFPFDWKHYATNEPPASDTDAASLKWNAYYAPYLVYWEKDESGDWISKVTPEAKALRFATKDHLCPE